MTDKTLRSANGAPSRRQQQQPHRRPRSPVLMQAHLVDGETRPLRPRAHSRSGWCTPRAPGAYGTFTVTHDISAFSKADLFNAVGKQTPVFLRFSTVAGEKGAADAERDARLRPQVLHRAGQSGIWWATTPRCSSSAIPRNSLTSSTPRSGIRAPTCAAPPPPGTSGPATRIPAPGHHPLQRSRHFPGACGDERLRQPHLQLSSTTRTSASGSSSTSRPSRPPLLHR